MAASHLQASVKLDGLFFKNPVGQLHRNIYTVLDEMSQTGAAAAATYLTPGHGVLSGALRDSIEPRFLKANRFNHFTGRAVVIAGAKGSWAPSPSAGTSSPWNIAEARNRAVAKKRNQKLRFMFRGAAAVKAWADGNRSHIEAIMARNLS